MPIRVLICDDEGLTALRYGATLKRLGYEVVGSAANGEQVLEAALRLRPDLILMDIEMPELDGISATRRITAACPTAIVVISAYSEPETVEAAMTAGASGYLVKPVTDDQLEPAIHGALTRFAGRLAPGA